MLEEKLLPHDIEAEEAVVGSVLIDGDSILRVVPFLKATDFYRERNRLCYEACVSLFGRGETIDQITVSRQLGLDGRLDQVGGAAYLSHLVAGVPTSVHIEHYGRIVNRTATMRSLIDAGSKITAIGYEDTVDVDGTLSKAEEALLGSRKRERGNKGDA
jgi:replicative DNA helicase